MLNENQLELLPERIYQRLNAINAEYLESIGGVIKEIGELRPSDVHKIQQMRRYGSNVNDIANKLAKASDKNVAEIYEIFDIVAKENYNYAEPFYKAKGKAFIPYEENDRLQKYVKSLAKQTVDEYKNITQHTAFAIFDKGGNIAPLFEANNGKVATSLSETYTKVIDYAVTKVQTGVTDYKSAMRSTLKALADSGIRSVDYATGYSRRLDSAVRQNILWGIKQCNQNTADQIGEDFGADGYEISYHSHPRPSHEDMGGKIYAIGKAITIDGVHYPSFEAEAKPLLEEYGCLHFKFSVLLGVSTHAHTKEQLAQLKANDKKKFEFEGREYTKYEASQTMSQIESRVKKLKDRANIAAAAGDDDLRREVQYNINLLTNKYAKLADVSGLPTKMEKMRVAGFKRTKGVSTPEGLAKYKAIINRKQDEKQYNRYISILGKENMPETFDKFQLLKYNNINEWDDLKYYARNINGRPIEYVKIDRELEKLGITKKGKAHPADDNIKAYILADKPNKREPYHIMQRMQERNITDDEVRSYKGKAKFVMVQWEGERREYYSEHGSCVIAQKDDEWIYKTAWKKNDFDEIAIKIMEVANEYIK